MARSMRDHNLWLFDLDAPLLDLGAERTEILLNRLKGQNFALDRLRRELACEDRLSFGKLQAAEGF